MTIDTSELTLDPDFCQPLRVIHRTSGRNNFGEVEVTESESEIVAVIHGVNAKTARTFPEAVVTSGAIEVLMHAKFGVPVTGQSATIVMWHGRRYRCTHVNDWSNWGQGFSHALCELEGRNG